MSEQRAKSFSTDNPNDYSEGKYQFSGPLMDQREHAQLLQRGLIGGEIVSYSFHELFEEVLKNPDQSEENPSSKPTQVDYLEAIETDPFGLTKSLEASRGGWIKPTTGVSKTLFGKVRMVENIIVPAIHVFRSTTSEFERDGLTLDKGKLWLTLREKHREFLKGKVENIFEEKKKEEFLTFGTTPNFRDWLIEREDWTIGLEYPKGIKPFPKSGETPASDRKPKRGRPKSNERIAAQIKRYKEEQGRTWKEIGTLLNKTPESVRKIYQREKNKSK